MHQHDQKHLEKEKVLFHLTAFRAKLLDRAGT